MCGGTPGGGVTAARIYLSVEVQPQALPGWCYFHLEAVGVDHCDEVLPAALTMTDHRRASSGDLVDSEARNLVVQGGDEDESVVNGHHWRQVRLGRVLKRDCYCLVRCIDQKSLVLCSRAAKL